MTTSDPSQDTHRLFITDRENPVRYLIETGADLCVYQCASILGPLRRTKYEFAAASGTTISTYGAITVPLNLGFQRTLLWKFIIAEVPKAIIEPDFLDYHVDLQGSQVIDRDKKIVARGEVCSDNRLSPNHYLKLKTPPATGSVSGHHKA